MNNMPKQSNQNLGSGKSFIASALGKLIINDQLIIELANAACEKALGMDCNKLVSKHLSEIITRNSPQSINVVNNCLAANNTIIANFWLKQGEDTESEYECELLSDNGYVMLTLISELKHTHNYNKFAKLNQVFLEPGSDFEETVNRITSLCGELLKADCALYNRLDQGMLCSAGQWNTPDNFNPVDKPEGHICYDVVQQASDEIVFISNLSVTSYALTDPNVKLYGLETYIGHVVRCNNKPVGSLCVVFTQDYKADIIDYQIIKTLALWLSNFETQKALVESEKRYHQLFEFAGGGIAIGDHNGVITDANKKLLAMTGTSENNLIGKHVSELFTKESLQMSPLRFDLLEMGGTVVNTRTLKSKHEGGVIVEMHSTKQPNGTYQAIFIDISEKNRLEQDHYKTSQQYKALFELAPVGILILSENGQIIEGNNTICETFGQKNTTLKGLNIHSFVPDQIAYKVDENIARILKGEKLQHEVATRKTDGTILYSELFETAIPLADGKTGILSISKDITERKNTENAIRESEQKFRALAEASPAAIFIHQNGLFVYTNPATQKITGFSTNELHGMKFWEIIHPDFREMVKTRGLDRVSGKDVPANYEFKIFTRDGSELWLDFAGALTTYNGAQAGMGFAYDITAHKKAQESVQAQRANLQKIIDKIPNSLFIKDINGKLLLVNQAFANLFKLSPHEIIGKSEKDFALDKNMLERYASEDRDVILNNRQLTIYEELLLDTGPKYSHTVKTPIGFEGVSQSVVLGITTDITSLKITEDQLRKSEITYRGIIDSVTEAIYIQDENGVFLDVNKAVETMYGYSREYFIGKTPGFLAAPDRNNIPKVADAIASAYNGTPASFEFWGIRKNGDIFPKEVSLTPGNYFGKKAVIAVARDITARKEAEGIINERKRILRTVLDNVPIGIWMLGVDGRLKFVNKSFCDAVGISEPTFLNTPHYSNLYDEHTAQVCAASDQLAFAANEPVMSQERLLFTDNKLHDTEIYKLKITNENNQTEGLIGISIDVTERNLMEANIRQKLLFTKALNSIAETIISTEDPETIYHVSARILGESLNLDRFEIYSVSLQNQTATGMVEWLNRSSNEISETLAVYPYEIFKNSLDYIISTHQHIENYSSSPAACVLEDLEFLSANYAYCRQKMIPPEALDAFYAEVPKIKAGLWYPFWFTSDGCYIFALNRLSTDAQWTHEELDFIDAASRQISIALEKIHLIEERGKAEAELRKLSHAVEQSPACNIITDINGIIIYINSKVTELTGFLPEEVIGNTMDILSSGLSDSGQTQDLWSTIKSGKIWKGEFLNKKKSGQQYWAHASISPILNNKGEITYYLSVQEDISERKQNMLDLQQALEKAKESDNLKTAFLNNISHEIRTPLNGIQGFAELLYTPELTDDERNSYTKAMQGSIDRLINTVEDYVDISMLATNTTRIYKSSIALTPFLEELHLKYTEICFDKDLKINLTIPESPNNITISCDASLIRKTFQHLLNNAVKFTPSGSINFGYTIQHDEIEFFVKDTGSGIEKEALDLVFKYFMQENTATTRGHEGSGLGLSIVKGFVELMGGHIRCKSTKNKGSDFFFTIPLPQDLGDNKNNRISRIRYPDNSLIKIIVAEDDPDNYYYLSTLLKLHTDSIVFHAKTGYEALQLLAEHPDTVLIFMDLKMPKMDGLEATKKIRASGRNDLFIIAITAHAGNEDTHNAIEAGCDNYITKPVNTETIANLLRNIGIKTKPLSGKS